MSDQDFNLQNFLFILKKNFNVTFYNFSILQKTRSNISKVYTIYKY